MDIRLIIEICIAVILVFLTAWVQRVFEKKPALQCYLGSMADFEVDHADGKKTKVYTHSLVIQNTGKLAANNVRIGHPLYPGNLRITPQIEHQINPVKDGSAEVLIPKLVPKDIITLSYLYFSPISLSSIHSYVKSDEGHAKFVSMLPTRQFSKPVRVGLNGLLILGIMTFSYLLITLITFTINKLTA